MDFTMVVPLYIKTAGKMGFLFGRGVQIVFCGQLLFFETKHWFSQPFSFDMLTEKKGKKLI